MAFLAFHQMSAEVVCEPTCRIALGLLHRGHQLPGFFVGVDHGLFEIDVLARVHGVHGHLAVPVVRTWR